MADEIQSRECSGCHPELSQGQNGHVASELAHVGHDHNIPSQSMLLFASSPFTMR